MKVTKITRVGKRKVYDLSVDKAEHYVLENGVVTHNTGILLSSNIAWIMGRRQDKDADGINGYHFIINVEKSRMVKEKSQIPISVTYSSGVETYSGLLDVALELGWVTKPSVGWYQRYDPITKKETSGKVRADDTSTKAFFDPILNHPEFIKAVKTRYQTGQIKLLADDVADIIAQPDETE